MTARDAHRFDRLHQVRQVEEQRARQSLVAAHAALRTASQLRDEVRAAAMQLPENGLRDLAVFRTELSVGQLRNEQLAAAETAVHQAETVVVAAHNAWSLAARKVQGLDKLVERRREEARADALTAEANEAQDLFQARRAMEQS